MTHFPAACSDSPGIVIKCSSSETPSCKCSCVIHNNPHSAALYWNKNKTVRRGLRSDSYQEVSKATKQSSFTAYLTEGKQNMCIPWGIFQRFLNSKRFSFFHICSVTDSCISNKTTSVNNLSMSNLFKPHSLHGLTIFSLFPPHHKPQQLKGTPFPTAICTN